MEAKYRRSATVMEQSSESSPVHHTQRLKAQMQELISHLRKDAGEVTEPKAQALFETSAEVITGLVKAFADYEEQSEDAWRIETVAARPKGRSTSATRR
jgi:hypothetical protein